MTSRIVKYPRAGLAALALGLGAVGSLAAAPAAMATLPVSGNNCTSSDGKITGRGSTFQEAAQWSVFIPGFNTAFCGNPTPQSPLTGNSGGFSGGDPASGATSAQSAMVDYNDYTGCVTGGVTAVGAACHVDKEVETSGTVGSGQGIATMQCRADAFGGSDLPYTEVNLTSMNVTPPVCGTAPVVKAPYYPGNTSTYPSVLAPATANNTAGTMSIPITGGPVALGVNLATNADGTLNSTICTVNAADAQAHAINITLAALEDIWDGHLSTWVTPNGSGGFVTTNLYRAAGTNSPTDPGLNTFLGTDGCTGAIIREARADNSGTTSIVMTTLEHVDPATSLCGGLTAGTTTLSWGINTAVAADNAHQIDLAYNNNLSAKINSTGNITWPTQQNGNTTCGTTQPGEATGTDGVITAVQANPGSIGYGEVGKWISEGGGTNPPAGIALASIQDETDATAVPPVENFIAPTAGNCGISNLGSTALPGATATTAVGLGTGNANWAADSQLTNGATGAQPNKEDITAQGTNYPVCGLTFDFVEKGGHSEAATNPLAGFSNDQKTTLNYYMLYILSPQGQSGLTAKGYEPLSTAWLNSLRSGFSANY
jgi:hypothetical protein